MKKSNMVTGPIMISLLLFALPLLISNIFQQLYNTVDTIVIGNHLGEISLAALGAGMAVFQLLVGFSLGFGNGFGIVVARHYGAGDETKVKESVAMSIIIGGLIIGLVMLLSFLFLEDLLVLLRTPEEIIGMTYDYIRIITMFVGVMFLYNLGSGLLRSIGNSMIPFLFLIISSVLNIFFDLLFVVQFGYGIKGAAYATVIAQSISVILVCLYIFTKAKILVPSRAQFRINREIMRDLVGQGLSMALMSSFVIVGTIILQYSINGMGYLIIAGHTVARRIQSLLFLPIVALVMSIATFVSQNKGAGQRERIVKATNYVIRILLGWGVITGILAFMVGELLLTSLSGSVNEVVIKTGSDYLKFNAPFYGSAGVLLTMRFVLQGLGEKIKPLISSIIELVMKFLFVVAVIPFMGYKGVIISEPIIWGVMLIQIAWSYYKHPYIQATRHTVIQQHEREVSNGIY